MEKVVKNSTNIIFKKDFFIKSRKEDIRLVYEFSPKATFHLSRSSAEVPTASSTRPGTSSHLTPTAL